MRVVRDSRVRRFACLLAVFGLWGCQSTPPSHSPVYHPTIDEASTAAPEKAQQAPPAVRAPAVITPVKAQGAIDSMIVQAQSSLAQGLWRQAVATAERGLRVDRREPQFYWLLAQSYLGLGDAQQAQAFAQQGLRYAPSGSGLQRNIQRFLQEL